MSLVILLAVNVGKSRPFVQVVKVLNTTMIQLILVLMHVHQTLINHQLTALIVVQEPTVPRVRVQQQLVPHV